MRTIVIMPGGFHPFHAGHMSLYNSAKKAFPGADVYVAATNDTSERPFPFAIKEKLAKVAGVPPGRFVQVKSPFSSEEITSKYDPNDTVLIFVKSEKNSKNGSDPEGPFPAEVDPTTGKLPLVTRGPRKGQPVSDRLQYYKGNEKNLQPMSRHSYLAYLPTVEFGPGIKSGSELRNAWPKLDNRRKTAFVMSMYPATQKNEKLAANVVKMIDMGMGEQQGVAEGSLNEFAVDGFGDSGDKRSKLLASVGRLLDGGNKVDWQVPGQMGHVTRVQNDGITMKKWKTPHSRMSFFLPMNDDSRDSKYTIKMVAPKHYAIVSAEQNVTEGTRLSVEQLAHISDKALDDAYHYGRSTPGANFGWLANVQSAKAAKRLIDAGETDIEKISDAIHKGWNVTAAADYKGQLQLDTPTPDEKKLKRAKLAMQSYSQLPEEEKEKDRVVARALLVALRGKIDETQGLPYPSTYEQETEPLKSHGARRIIAMTNEGINMSESLDYLEEK